MTENQQTLFVQFEYELWDKGQLEDLTNAMDAVTPEGCGVVAIPQDIDLLTKEDVLEIAEMLQEAVGEDE